MSASTASADVGEGRPPRTVLVTGGGGFVGRHLVAKLLARGDRVRVYGRRRYPDLARLGVDCRRGGVQNPTLTAAACAGVDVVFHLAALADLWGAYGDFHATNVLGTLNIVAAAGQAGVGKLVYGSTPSVVYRGPIRGGDESLPYSDRYESAYAETKAKAERIVLGANHDGLLTCALRPHLVWGPGDNHIVPGLLERARAGTLRRVGAGNNRISVSYVENVADAFVAAADRLTAGGPVAGQAYFINDDEPVVCWDFIDEILSVAGAPTVGGRSGVPLPAAYGLGALLEAWGKATCRRRAPRMTRFLALQLGTDHWFSNAKAREELGWTPEVSHEEGLRRTVLSLREGRSRVFDGLSAPSPSAWAGGGGAGVDGADGGTGAKAAVVLASGKDAAGPPSFSSAELSAPLPDLESGSVGGGVVDGLAAARGTAGRGPTAEQLLAERGILPPRTASGSFSRTERVMRRQRAFCIVFLVVLILAALAAWLFVKWRAPFLPLSEVDSAPSSMTGENDG